LAREGREESFSILRLRAAQKEGDNSNPNRRSNAEEGGEDAQWMLPYMKKYDATRASKALKRRRGKAIEISGEVGEKKKRQVML